MDWLDQFYMSLEVECCLYPGNLRLECTSIEYDVASGFEDPWSTCAADLDGDQDMDVLAVSYNNHAVSCWLNQEGTGTSWQTVFMGEVMRVESIISADFDGDGDQDAATLSEWEGIDVWLNSNGQGTSWVRSPVSNFYYGHGSLYPSDPDGDGDVDLFACASESDLLCWFENMNGSGSTWVEHVLDDSCSNIRSMCAADIDGDGDEDVFGAGWTSAYVSWWENPGGTGPEWQEHFIDENFEKASEVFSCDMDGDVDVDVVGTSMQDSEVRWWENADGSGEEWLPHEIGSQYGAFTVCASDTDNDGDFDVIVGGRGNNSVCLYTNISGPGLVWSSRVIDPDDADPYCVRAADLNGDNLPDVIVAETDFFTELSWWNINVYPQTGYLTSSILNMEEEPQWLAVDWSGEEPSGTETVFQFRTGKNPLNLGYWTEYIYQPCDLCDIVSPGDTLFQYRVRFFSDNVNATPMLEDFLVSWDVNGCSEQNNITDPIRISPNPAVSGSSFSVRMDVAELTDVELALRDLSGRTVYSRAFCCQAGQSGIELQAPAPGLYFITTQIEGLSLSRKLIVVR